MNSITALALACPRSADHDVVIDGVLLDLPDGRVGHILTGSSLEGGCLCWGEEEEPSVAGGHDTGVSIHFAQEFSGPIANRVRLVVTCLHCPPSVPDGNTWKVVIDGLPVLTPVP